MLFNKAYYESNAPKQDHNHFQLRADWIIKSHNRRKVIELGCGFGSVIYRLRKSGIIAWGVDVSRYALEHSYAPNFVFNSSIEDYKYIAKNDFVVSWNLLDCLSGEDEAARAAEVLSIADKSYHVFCMDNNDSDSQHYKELEYFIKPASYWLSLVGPKVVLIDYHTGNVYNHPGPLNMPLSWGNISK